MEGKNQSVNFWDLWVLRSKFTKFLIFSSNFASIFNVMRHNSQLLCTFLADILYTFNKRSLSRYKFGEIKSLKFGILMGSFCQNNIKFQLKRFRRVICLDTKEWWILKKNWSAVLNKTWGTLWIFTPSLKSPQISLWWSVFSLQSICEVWAKKYRGVIFHETGTAVQNLNKPWLCGFKNGMRNSVNFHYSTQKSEKLYIDGLFWFKAYVSVRKFLRNFVSWQWRVMQSLKKNWLLAPKMTSGI